jgi:hypothetical protein
MATPGPAGQQVPYGQIYRIRKMLLPTPLALGSHRRYINTMLNQPRPPLYVVSDCQPFLHLLSQMEGLCRATDLVWHPNVAADVRKRLRRLERSLRLGPQSKSEL